MHGRQKALALAKAKKFKAAMTRDTVMISDEEYKNEEKIVVASDGSTSTVKIMDKEKRDYEAKRAAWAFLLISHTSRAFDTMVTCMDETSKAWKKLLDKYESKEVEEEHQNSMLPRQFKMILTCISMILSIIAHA